MLVEALFIRAPNWGEKCSSILGLINCGKCLKWNAISQPLKRQNSVPPKSRAQCSILLSEISQNHFKYILTCIPVSQPFSLLVQFTYLLLIVNYTNIKYFILNIKVLPNMVNKILISSVCSLGFIWSQIHTLYSNIHASVTRAKSHWLFLYV